MRYLKLFLIMCLLGGVACDRGPKAEQPAGQGQTAVAPVRIAFEAGGRKYEAVSFLRAGETWITVDEMIARTDGKNGGGLGKEDAELLWEHRSELPKELAPYVLDFTKWPNPNSSRSVRCFSQGGGQWYQTWDWSLSEGQWYGHHRLVVRRLL